MQCHVYMLASARHGTLYVGVTSQLVQRIYQHREGLAPGFTRDHGVKSWSGSKELRPSKRPFRGKSS
jgi:predicted GIY-YIG superfamily endonuclease